jgi:predicted GIY-YIG superfamily endonuclease
MNKVYLIQSLEDSYYKIGVSKHPQKRISEHQTSNPSPLKLIDTYSSEHAYQIESILKRRYAYLKKEGEWFDLSIDIEVNFKKTCEKIEENLTFLKKNGNVFI